MPVSDGSIDPLKYLLLESLRNWNAERGEVVVQGSITARITHGIAIKAFYLPESGDIEFGANVHLS